MQTIPHSVCGAIPEHMLRHLAAQTDDEASVHARTTLVQMNAFKEERRSLVQPMAAIEPPKKRRNIYNARHQHTLPGKLVMNEKTKRSDDVEVLEAWDGSGATHDFWRQVFGRNSIDDRGMRLDSTVHHGVGFNNALWNGQQMVYGDGDGRIFNRFTAAPDVIAHELTHGITQFSSSLGYEGQSGALNEHLSDAFGIMVKQWMLGLSANESDWLIGEGLFGPGVRGKALRSMAAPGTAYDDPILGKDPQPAHMRQYQRMSDDNGGVHINSGIPNHAFYLTAVRVGGESWSIPGRIWYQTLETKVAADTQFQDFANATVLVAGQIHGNGESVQTAVANSWSDVGITVPKALLRKPSARAPRFWERVKDLATIA